jgi:hypothetical protein
MTRAWAIVLLFASGALAHPTLQTYVVIDASRDEDGGFVEILVTHDVPAYALNSTSAEVLDWQMYELLEGPDEVLDAALTDARERFESGFWLLADGERIEYQLVRAPDLQAVQAWKADNPTWRLPLAMQFVLKARLPEGASELAVRAPHVLDEVFVVFKNPGAEERYLTAGVAEVSAGLDVSTVSEPVIPVAAPALEEPAPPSRGGWLGGLGVAAVALAGGAFWWARAKA